MNVERREGEAPVPSFADCCHLVTASNFAMAVSTSSEGPADGEKELSRLTDGISLVGREKVSYGIGLLESL